ETGWSEPEPWRVLTLLTPEYDGVSDPSRVQVVKQQHNHPALEPFPFRLGPRSFSKARWISCGSRPASRSRRRSARAPGVDAAHSRVLVSIPEMSCSRESYVAPTFFSLSAIFLRSRSDG